MIKNSLFLYYQFFCKLFHLFSNGNCNSALGRKDRLLGLATSAYMNTDLLEAIPRIKNNEWDI